MKKIIFSDIDSLTKKIKNITLDFNEDFVVNLNDQLSRLFRREINVKIPDSDLKDMITEHEIRSIIISSLKRTKSGRYAILEKDLDQFIELFRTRFASNVAAFMVKNNYVEQAYDEEEDNFCFF